MEHLLGTLVLVPLLSALGGDRSLDVLLVNDGASFAFVPRQVEVAPGTTVRWINHDVSPHRIELRRAGLRQAGLGFGPLMAASDATLDGGAGGRARLAGDYLYLNHRLPFLEAGQWGLFRVYAARVPQLLPLP